MGRGIQVVRFGPEEERPAPAGMQCVWCHEGLTAADSGEMAMDMDSEVLVSVRHDPCAETMRALARGIRR